MSQRLAKHGTWAGYKAELETGNVCDRCRKASRVYNSQYNKTNKAKGIRYRTDEVLDHLYIPTGRGIGATRYGTPVPPSRQNPVTGASPDMGVAGADVIADGSSEPSMADRLRDGLRGLTMTREPANDYVPADEIPDYIAPIEPDPEPQSGEWSRPVEDEYVITAEGIKDIKDNLGTYLATVGMTLGIIDPYCGNAIRNNLDDMVDGWARVITHYPSAAKLFMAKGGGKIMAWIDALMATWPVLLAIYEHHLAKTVTINSLGQPVRVTKDESPNGHFATQPDFNYTVD